MNDLDKLPSSCQWCEGLDQEIAQLLKENESLTLSVLEWSQKWLKERKQWAALKDWIIYAKVPEFDDPQYLNMTHIQEKMEALEHE